jgi:hypothetical protein
MRVIQDTAVAGVSGGIAAGTQNTPGTSCATATHTPTPDLQQSAPSLPDNGVAADEAIDVGNTASLDSPTADSQIPFDVDEQFQNGRTEAFADVLRQMALMTGATYADVDTWLVILHKKKPIPDYGKLPKNSRALFKPSPVYEDAFSSMRAMQAQVGKSTNAAMQRMHDAASNG